MLALALVQGLVLLVLALVLALALEIGRIYMGNYAGLALEILKGLLRRYDPVHGVIYVVVFTH